MKGEPSVIARANSLLTLVAAAFLMGLLVPYRVDSDIAFQLKCLDRMREIKKAGTELGRNVNTVQAISDLADQNAREYGMKRCGKQQQLPIT